MKTFVLIGLGMAAMVVAAEAQTTINFCNSCLPSPPDRLVRDVNGAPLTGTNFVAQLYMGLSPDSLAAHSAAPARFRPANTTLPGTWQGGNRTIVGFAARQELCLQVRVWDFNVAPTYEQARSLGSPGAESSVFTWTTCDVGSNAACFLMLNFRGFQVGTLPTPPVLQIRHDGDRIALLYDGKHTIQATSNLLSGPWITIGTDSAPFIDPDSNTIERRFYRINDGGLFSQNAVGYYDLRFCPSFSLIANQLHASGGNTLENVFRSPPNGMSIYKFNFLTGGYTVNGYVDGAWEGDDLSMTLNPGEGAFVHTPAAFTNRFLGEVGRTLRVTLPSGFSLISSPLPAAGPINLLPPGGLGFPISNGDAIYRWFCGANGYFSDQYIDGAWEGDSGGQTPTLAIGEAFFYYNSGPSRSWSQTFNVGP